MSISELTDIAKYRWHDVLKELPPKDEVESHKYDNEPDGEEMPCSIPVLVLAHRQIGCITDGTFINQVAIARCYYGDKEYYESWEFNCLCSNTLDFLRHSEVSHWCLLNLPEEESK